MYNWNIQMIWISQIVMIFAGSDGVVYLLEAQKTF